MIIFASLLYGGVVRCGNQKVMGIHSPHYYSIQPVYMQRCVTSVNTSPTTHVIRFDYFIKYNHYILV